MLRSSRNLWILVNYACILSLMQGALPWVLSILLFQIGGPLFLGLVFAVANIDDVIMTFFGGGLADRYGRRPVLIFSGLMYVCGTCLLVVSMFVGGFAGQAALFMAVICLYGMSGVSSGPASALLVESVEPHHVGRAFSLWKSTSLLFRSLGSAALGVIYQRSPVIAAFVTVFIACVSTLLLFRIHETLRSEITPREESITRHFVTTFRSIGQLAVAGLILVVLLVVMNGFGHGVAGNFFAPFLEEFHGVSPAVIGSTFAAIPLAQAILVLLAGWLVDRRGSGLSLAIGNVAVGAWILFLGVGRSASLAITATVVSAGLGAFHGIAFNTAVARLSEERTRGMLFGGLEGVWNAMFIVGPLVGGTLYGLRSPLPFVVAGAILVSTLLPIWMLSRHESQRRGTA